MAHDTVGDLIRAVERNGANQIEVIRGEANSFAIRKSSLASCTVILLEHEPTFHVDFDLGLRDHARITLHQ